MDKQSVTSRSMLLAVVAGLVFGVGAVAEAAPSKGSGAVVAAPLPVSVVTPKGASVLVISPALVVVSPAATPASGVAPTKGGSPSTGAPAFAPIISPIPPLPPSAPVGP